MLPFIIFGISVFAYIIFLISFALFAVYKAKQKEFRYSGYDGARLVLQLHNRNDVKIVMDEKRGDSYNKDENCIYLLPSTYKDKTINAFTTGAHEASHAIHTRFFGYKTSPIYFFFRKTMFIFLFLSLFIKAGWVHLILLISFIVVVGQELITLTFLEVHNNYKTLQNIKKIPGLSKSDIKIAKQKLWLINVYNIVFPFIIWWNRYKLI